ncbi:MAG: RsbRD N-terminal domain-containing protein [Bacteroidota bacterium]
MNIREFIIDNKNEISRLWFDETVKSYRDKSAGFLARSDRRFTNPAGSAINDAVMDLAEYLAGKKTLEEIKGSLEHFIRLRAVQDYYPSEALRPIFAVKEIVADLCGIRDYTINETQMNDFLIRVDNLMLHAFDIYMESREKIFRIQAGEQKRTFERAVNKINKKYGL